MSVDCYQRLVPHALYIKTNSYAGNFEQELCAFVTGLADYRGKEYARDAKEAYAELLTELAAKEAIDSAGDPYIDHEDEDDYANDYITQHMDSASTGTYGTNVTMADANDDHEYNDVAIFFCEKPDEAFFDLMVKRVHLFPQFHAQQPRGVQGLKILGIEWQSYNTVVQTTVEQLMV